MPKIKFRLKTHFCEILRKRIYTVEAKKILFWSKISIEFYHYSQAKKELEHLIDISSNGVKI